MRISIELVPRDLDVLKDEIVLIHRFFPMVSNINIPDMHRLPHRSWKSSLISKPFYPNTIPHIRAVDFDLTSPLELVNWLNAHDIFEILIINGDEPKTYPTSTIHMIHHVKQKAPHIKIYAAIDPYRQPLEQEIAYVQAKKNAGASGFFTQPFFDVSLFKNYANALMLEEVFWGITPVLSDRSKTYWENVNSVHFPSDFVASMDWNVEFAKTIMDTANKQNQHVYFMPIKAPLFSYLSHIFL